MTRLAYRSMWFEVAGMCLLASAGAVDAAPADRAVFHTDVLSYEYSHREQVDLSGEWEFRRDTQGRVEAEQWWQGEGDFDQTITIPGAPQAQGIGEPTPSQKSHFPEPFWVRKRFRAPRLGADDRLWLRIGGIAPAAEIYVNGQYLGYTKSSRTQQRVDVTSFIDVQKENLIAIKVCDRPEVRLDGIWEMAELAMNWSGVYRPVRFEIANRTSLIDFYLQPRLADGSVNLEAVLSEPAREDLVLEAEALDGDRSMGSSRVTIKQGEHRVSMRVTLDQFTPWSPAHPTLYTLEMSLVKAESREVIDRVAQRFGMREVRTEGTKILLNGQPIFIRAFGDDQYYPETICPPADKQWYLSRLKRAREYGMNASKGCVETLPPEYIEAADEAGILVIQEMPFGLSGLRANRYTIDETFRDFYATELDGLVRQSRNYASVVSYSMSSELEHHNQTPESFVFFSQTLPKRTRELAPHALVIDCTGYVTTEETDKGKRDTDFYASICPTWMKRTLDETPVATDRKRPTILHEYNWWSCYPDPNDGAKYAGMQLKPFWLETLLETARANGQEELIPTYRKNSLWLQTICRKDGIEYARRNPDTEGYILWLLIDFGQYSEGLLDDFWQPKNVSAEEFLQSNGDTVVLLAEDGDRCLEPGEQTQVNLAISHYGEADLEHATVEWRAGHESSVASGVLTVDKLPTGELTQAGAVTFPGRVANKVSRCKLRVVLKHAGKTINTNEWSFWQFPSVSDVWRKPLPEAGRQLLTQRVLLRCGDASTASIPPEVELVIAETADETLISYVEDGGRCLLLARDVEIENRNVYYGTVSFYPHYRTIPWNAGRSGNSGTVVARHPAIDKFTDRDYCDLHFVRLFRDRLPMEFEPLREFGVTPIIRMIDHYAANRNNAHMLEFRCGKGSVIATTLNLLPLAADRIEARYLLQTLVDYARGDTIQPRAVMPADTFLKWFSPYREEAETQGPNELLK